MEIRVPSVGESVTEGTVARWFKKDGESVRTGEPLYELETEKATTEVPSPVAGRLRIAVPEGRTVPIGSVVGQIEAEEGGRSAKLDVKAKPRADGQSPAQSPLPERPRPEQSTGGGGDPPPSKSGEPLLSPAARRLAKEAGIDPQSVAGTGRGGRVTKEDVLTHLERAKETPPAPESSAPIVGGAPAALTAARPALPAPPARAGDRPHETRQRMSAIRQRIADRLVAAKNTAAILTTFNEVDLSAVLALRAQYKESFRERHGIGLGFMSFFVIACVEALKAFPIVNARIDGGEVVYHHFYDIGVAVSTDQGLMVPVVRGADLLSFAEVEARVAALAVKAREGKIEVADLQGGTFTITNGGVFGSLLSTPILNAPQSAILGMHAIQKRPVALGEEVVIRPMMYVALSYDHRLIDGREAVQFLVRIKQCIESPERLLLEV